MDGIDSGATSILNLAKVSKNQRSHRLHRGHLQHYGRGQRNAPRETRLHRADLEFLRPQEGLRLTGSIPATWGVAYLTSARFAATACVGSR